MFDKVNETGKEGRTFETGSVRDSSEGKGRQDLIPPYPLKRLAQHYENGAKKYGDRNWEMGQPVNEYYNSAFRHLTAWMDGDNSEDHLSAGVWNLFGMIHTMNEIQKGKLPFSLVASLPEEIRGRLLKEAKIKFTDGDLIEEEPYVSPVASMKKDGEWICDCTDCFNARAEKEDEELTQRILEENIKDGN